MKDSSERLLLNAEETLNAAQVLLNEEYLRDAVNRAYYAVFYITEALLNEKDLRFKKHGAVHGAFARHYIKTGLFDAKYHKLLLLAFGRRMLGDYDEAGRSRADARRVVGLSSSEPGKSSGRGLGPGRECDPARV